MSGRCGGGGFTSSYMCVIVCLVQEGSRIPHTARTRAGSRNRDAGAHFPGAFCTIKFKAQGAHPAG
jgi:hypothetical protein